MLPLALFSLWAGATALPPAITPEPNSRCPGWQPAPAAPRITSWLHRYRFKFAPNLVSGDFNSSGNTGFVPRIKTKQRQRFPTAFMDRGGTFETHILVTDLKKDSTDFDCTTLKLFRHPADAADLMYFEKTPLPFSYRKGIVRGMLSPAGEEISK